MRIRKRKYSVDFRGRVLSEHVEQLSEDGQGNVEEVHASAVYPCEACGRPVEKIDDVRGRCVECGRLCCVTCAGACSVCHRPLCGSCRLGHAAPGQQNFCVCAACLEQLQRQLARQERLLKEKVAFDRSMALYDRLMRLLPPGTGSGSLIDILVRIGQVRLARRLERIARRIAKEEGNGRRLLP